jgi:hypothetical protein
MRIAADEKDKRVASEIEQTDDFWPQNPMLEPFAVTNPPSRQLPSEPLVLGPV